MDFLESGHSGALVSHLCAALAIGSVVLPIVLLLVRRASVLRSARAARRAFDPSAPLREGPGHVSGTVELPPPARYAVRVEIEQRGEEHRHKDGWDHAWTEVKRRTSASPFYLRRPDGERVRVEPGTDLLLVDEADRTEWIANGRRKRIAELSAGEQAIVEGVIERGPGGGDGGYRDGGSEWVVRAAPGQRLHVSSEPLEKRHLDRARTLARAAGFLLVLGVGMLGAGGPYFLRLVDGEPVLVEVTGRNESVERVLGKRGYETRRTFHVAIRGVRDPSVARGLSVSYDAYRQLRRGLRFMYRHVRRLPEAGALGRDATMHWVSSVGLGVLALAALALFVTLDDRRWYEGKLHESGSGPLPRPTLEEEAAAAEAARAASRPKRRRRKR